LVYLTAIFDYAETGQEGKHSVMEIYEQKMDFILFIKVSLEQFQSSFIHCSLQR